jgi:predicted KAP-like P-loop ATPase
VPIAGYSGGAIAKFVKGIGKGLADKSPSPDIQKLKDEIAAKLQKEKVKTIIIIDDVDRLSNQEICSVFQLIKSIADFPNTIYLLAFDFEVVSRALGKVQNTDGKKYLEKIIQVPFHLPKINAQQLANLFFKGLDNIIREIPEEKFDKERWALLFHYGIKEHLKTIRDVVRLNNTISLKYSFLKGEVNIIDLIGITTIQVFTPNIYNQLQFYKDNLLLADWMKMGTTVFPKFFQCYFLRSAKLRKIYFQDTIINIMPMIPFD